MARCLNFLWVGYQPPIIWNCVLTPKKSPAADIACGFWAELSRIYANVRPQRRKPYITKLNMRENDAGFKWILGAESSGVATLLKCNCGGRYKATIFCTQSPQVLYRWRAFITFIRRKIGKNSYSSVSKITYPWKLTLGIDAWVGDGVSLYTTR